MYNYSRILSSSLADDNPYPVIDNDFLDDSIENLIQSDIYENIDFLTGVTLNEGLYFAEYHIGHFYSDLNVQSASIGKRPSNRQKRSTSRHLPAIIPPDIIITGDQQNEENDYEDHDEEEYPDGQMSYDGQTHVEQILSYDPKMVLAQFSRIDYIARYIAANFQYGSCFLDETRKIYEHPGKNNSKLSCFLL